MNLVILSGNVGTDPFFKTIKEGGKMAMFKLVTDTHVGEKVHNEWHELVCWNDLADAVEKILKKGDMIELQGFLKTRSVDDPQGGKRFYTEIHVRKFTKIKTHVQKPVTAAT